MYYNSLKFEWDPRKDQYNRRKHDVSFREASTAFYDDDAILFDDPNHSEEEERCLLIGMTVFGRLLIVSHCYRKNDSVIRVISARKATKTEENYYLDTKRKRRFA